MLQSSKERFVRFGHIPKLRVFLPIVAIAMKEDSNHRCPIITVKEDSNSDITSAGSVLHDRSLAGPSCMTVRYRVHTIETLF